MDNYLKIDPFTHSYLGYGSVQYKALSVIGSDIIFFACNKTQTCDPMI